MRLLIRFEDTYGMYSIFSKIRNLRLDNPTARDYLRVGDDLYVQYGLSCTKSLDINLPTAFDIAERGIDKIIIIFDLDNENGDKSKLMSKEYITRAVINSERSFISLGYTIDIRFMPVVYSAETIALYQYLTDKGKYLDVESLVHVVNTNEFQLLLLNLLNIQNKDFSKTNVFEKYLDCNTLLYKIKANLESGRLNINKELLLWLLSGCGLDYAFKNKKETVDFVELVTQKFQEYKYDNIKLTVCSDIISNTMSLTQLKELINERRLNV